MISIIMIRFIAVAELPQTASGKVARGQLAELCVGVADDSRAARPLGALEVFVAEAWSAELCQAMDTLHVGSDFLDPPPPHPLDARSETRPVPVF